MVQAILQDSRGCNSGSIMETSQRGTANIGLVGWFNRLIRGPDCIILTYFYQVILYRQKTQHSSLKHSTIEPVAIT
jgi:hypothetical protein